MFKISFLAFAVLYIITLMCLVMQLENWSSEEEINQLIAYSDPDRVQDIADNSVGDKAVVCTLFLLSLIDSSWATLNPEKKGKR